MSQPLNLRPDEQALYDLLPEGCGALGNGKLRETLGWDEARYAAAKEGLLNSKLVAAVLASPTRTTSKPTPQRSSP